MEEWTMRLNPALLACILAAPALATRAAAEPATQQKLALQAPPLVTAPASANAGQFRLRADSLRKQGDYEAALEAYQSEMALSGESADRWKHIGWTQKALRRYGDAALSLQR